MTTDLAPQAHSGALLRPEHGRILAGVAAGTGDYLGVDATVVRLVLVALALLGGTGIPLYLAGWLLIPEPGRRSIAADWLHPDTTAQHPGGTR